MGVLVDFLSTEIAFVYFSVYTGAARYVWELGGGLYLWSFVAWLCLMGLLFVVGSGLNRLVDNRVFDYRWAAVLPVSLSFAPFINNVIVIGGLL